MWMFRFCCRTLIPLLLAAAAARASPYWVEDDPGAGRFPEDEGWLRFTREGGDERSIDDGWLVMDGMASPEIQDYYEIRRPGAIDPDPGEEFVMRWRIRVDELVWYHDPCASASSNEQWAVGFMLSRSAIYSTFEQDVSAEFEPGVAHTFEFRSADMRTYVLSIDGTPAIYGNFWLSLTPPRVAWGDGVYGGASLARWEYFEFGVVPECTSVLSVTCILLIVACSRNHTCR
jgi:hypothetical protein